MDRGRCEAFSDGVMAILITIMVLELHVPRGTDWATLAPLAPVFLCYVLSFLYLAIYWNNHHHLLQTVERINGRMLWANMHLLFWLSLFPFATGWMGENRFAPLPTALYGFVLLMAAVGWTILQRTIIAFHGPNSVLARAVGRDLKGRASLALYLTAIPLALRWPGAANALYVAVALLWLVPDRRIESRLAG